ncbi:FtsP/CotA-like multicopper oxidase with cupredoxin domain [Kitasatospora sp. GAS204A]|uniref:multicopper oxidase domain-containing protein n=1 Tax=unclassified Kitasatospora TaxID=2633591 RepID=UPI002474CC19|nr:multicopper oxidase domain-containing protein [Kitasatospora sp. GAS204B]MDH6117685.1 FtsP/CotA-like multicopper oxidase with cupredoxin domain [Kitasatospora sp. GAS204B]
MSADQASPETTRNDDHGRRSALRTLLAGGAATALIGSATLPASAEALTEPSAATGADPFAADTFRASGRVREYWIQAESFEHNAVPNGYDAMMGRHIKPEQSTFWAIGLRAYTEGWGRLLDADTGPQGVGANGGIPGPVLRAEVGDVLRVHFRNNDEHYKWPHSLHPHGVRYGRDADGGWLADDPDHPGTAVPFGGSYTYTWTCPPGSVGTWPYHDHAAPQAVRAGAEPMMEIGAELGLFGVLVVTDQKTPAVDREFVVFLHDLYRSDVPSLVQNLNLVNGGAYLDNTPTFTAKVGDRVRWRIASLGSEFHVFHLHGHRWRSGQGYQGWVDSQLIGPSSTLTVEYLEDNPGDWIYHCHVAHHMMGGMAGRYRVTR